MISLTIGDLNTMSRKDADALRAIAEVYHSEKRNDNMAVSTLRSAITRNLPGALETLAELNAAAAPEKVVTNVTLEQADAIKDAFITRGEVGALQMTGRVEHGAVGGATPYVAPPTTAQAVTAESTTRVFTDAEGNAILSYGPSLAEQFMASATKTVERVGGTLALHPHDNPAVGAPDINDLADKVFSGGAGVVNPTSESVQPDPHPTVPIDRADIDAAMVFSGGAQLAELGAQVFTTPAGGTHIMVDVDVEQPAPNVVSGSTNIPPPLPNVTAPISQQPSAGATTDSPPPPPPPAPLPDAASGAAPTTSPAPTVEVDKSGLPWDARIHASTKTKTAKELWTRRRGVEDSLVTEVEAQLRKAMAIPAGTPSAAPAASTGAWPFPIDSSSVTGAPTFPDMMQFITDRIGSNRLTQEQVQAAVRTTGLESLNLVMTRPDLIPAIMDELRKVAP